MAEDIVKHSVHTLVFRSLKRSHDMFLHDNSLPLKRDEKSDQVKKSCKIRDEYFMVKDFAAAKENLPGIRRPVTGAYPSNQVSDIPPLIEGAHPYPSAAGVALTPETAANRTQPSHTGVQQLMSSLPPTDSQLSAGKESVSIMEIQKKALVPAGGKEKMAPSSKALVAAEGTKSTALMQQRKATSLPKPQWHPPWKLMRVISGHTGWVRSVTVEPGNQWFATGSADRTIKIWELGSGKLKLSLTGHISTVRGLAVSSRQPYLFSCGEDKQVKCWDLEYNKVVRHYHGHLSAIYSLDLHPTIDVLFTCGRDATTRVWDMRTKACIHTLTGHTSTVAVVRSQAAEPQVITGSHDCTIRLWDLAAGKSKVTLTNHKKSIRALVLHPTQFSFASASPDNIKQWKFPDGNFLQNLIGHNSIVNCMAVNSDDVLVSGGDNGTMHFWDWKTGYNFQRSQASVQPGSLDSEAGIFAMTFDLSSSRLITCEADKTIKIYKEDDTASEETHPVNWKPEILKRKRY
ncbi:pleiotropic regulator 1-like [Acropora millepora]|uniref:pleiotropic regulator 1-like n=1 Tax=Acropora millepora TaxID=45264 RepID=UPI0010FC6875|nr:pleiotropic regulator 1-like [Acropora millepora]